MSVYAVNDSNLPVEHNHSAKNNNLTYKSEINEWDNLMQSMKEFELKNQELIKNFDNYSTEILGDYPMKHKTQINCSTNLGGYPMNDPEDLSNPSQSSMSEKVVLTNKKAVCVG